MEREKGVATTPCPTCGKDLPLQEQPDGGRAAVTCSDCHSSEKPEQAAAAPNREFGTDQDDNQPDVLVEDEKENA